MPLPRCDFTWLFVRECHHCITGAIILTPYPTPDDLAMVDHGE